MYHMFEENTKRMYYYSQATTTTTSNTTKINNNKKRRNNYKRSSLISSSSSSSSNTNNNKIKNMMRLSTDPQSVAARERRHRISDRFKILQSLVPGGSKMDTVSMLEEAIHYVKFLKAQIWLHHNFILVNDTTTTNNNTANNYHIDNSNYDHLDHHMIDDGHDNTMFLTPPDHITTNIPLNYDQVPLLPLPDDHFYTCFQNHEITTTTTTTTSFDHSNEYAKYNY